MRLALAATALAAAPLLVVAQASGASSATSASATSSSPGAAASSTGRPTVSLPPLYQCGQSTWTYTAPVPGPKYLGIYLSGTSNFIETYALPAVYDDYTNGTFTWKCDLPAGASVAAMFYVVQDGASGTNGQQASTPDAIINAGNSGSGCLGTNDPDSQPAILSLASSLDPSFTYSSDGSSPTSASSGGGGGGGGSTNIGAIVGGVVGGVCGIAVVALALIYLKRKHDLAAQNNDGFSVYSGHTEKRGSVRTSRYGGGPGSVAPPPAMNAPPPGTYYANDEHGNTILMMGGWQGDEPQQPFSPQVAPTEPSVLEMPTSPAPRTTAPPGMLPEPMDESTSPVSSPSAAGPLHGSTPSPAPAIPHSLTGATDYTPSASSTPAFFTPRSERDAFLGHQGLDDPSSFSINRQRG
ncbi:hypothetical protein JCM11641_008314 [Rhodosporidiobolus odoratus]